MSFLPLLLHTSRTLIALLSGQTEHIQLPLDDAHTLDLSLRAGHLHAELRGGPLLVLFAQTEISSLALRRSLLATIHEVPWAEPAGALGEHAASHKLRLHLAANFAARLLCVSERTAEQVRQLHPEAAPRVRVTPHGLDARWVAECAARPDVALPSGVRAPWVLAVGRLRKKKNLMRLLDAFAVRVGAGGSEQLVLVGPNDDASQALRARAPILISRCSPGPSFDLCAFNSSTSSPN